jgi:hypothetical protein
LLMSSRVSEPLATSANAEAAPNSTASTTGAFGVERLRGSRSEDGGHKGERQYGESSHARSI